ncbi:MAG TPA: ATP-binding cassette domain-containing protein [Candidatus Acidoferrales bacterium]|nr:ATP-binding cassette domain-containing protein [Candidatus Acidoferrales bacterium]
MTTPTSAELSAPLLTMRNLVHEYRPRSSSGKGDPVAALQGIDLELHAGMTVALVGESGSGKSTLAKCIARIERPTSGEICFEGKNIWTRNSDELRSFRNNVQLIFQDSATSLNPRFTNEEIVAEPLMIHGETNEAKLRSQVISQMGRLGLAPELADRRPLELSGGQRQRLAIARALMLKPTFLIFDEALSGLDLLVQETILDLVRKIQTENSLTYLFITHDLALAQELADEIVVLREGKIVERVPAAALFTTPRHEYTRRLVDSVQLLESAMTNAKS